MNTSSGAVSPTPGNLLDDFEEAYIKCLGPLINEDPFTHVDTAELQTNAEANTLHFIEMARAMQAFFIQKRFQLSAQKPELVMMEDVVDLRAEIARKDELIKKHTERLAEWQSMIAAVENRVGPGAGSACQQPPPQPQQTSQVGSQPQAGGSIPSSPATTPSTGAVMGGNRVGTPSMMGQGAVGHVMQGGVMNAGPQQGNMGGMDANGARVGLSMGSGANSPHMVMSNSSMLSPAGSQGGGVYSGMRRGAAGYSGSPQSGLQGPLAYLEQTTTSIGALSDDQHLH